MKPFSIKTYRYRLVAGAGLIALIAAVLIYTHYRDFRSVQPDGTIQIRYILTVKNKTNRAIKDAGVFVAAPVEQTATQQCLQIKASHPCAVSKDRLGNQTVAFHWDIFPPLSSKFITIQCDINTWRDPRPLGRVNTDDFLLPEPFIESRDDLVRAQAEKLESGSPQETTANIFKWVADHIDGNQYVGRNRGAAYALKYGKGDCTEYALLFTALCRAAGIPARPVGGFVCSAGSLVDSEDYHNWAEFYHGGRWHVADPQKNIFMSNSSSYIAFLNIQPSKGLNGSLIGGIEGNGLEVKIKSVNHLKGEP